MVKFGIIGGGQLSLMLCHSIIKKRELYQKIEIIYIYSNKNVIPCNILTTNNIIKIELIIGNFNDEKKFLDFCNKCDVVTYEFENIDIELLKKAEINHKIKYNNPNINNLIYPNIKYLEIIQDKLKQKEFLHENGFNIAPFQYIKGYEDIYYFIQRYNYPVIIKSRRGSFKGRGNFYIGNYGDFIKWYTNIGKFDDNIHNYYIENVIDFDNEFSIIGCKGPKKFNAIFDPVKNTHKNNILLKTEFNESSVPRFESLKMRNIERKILELFDTLGMVCIEFFHKGENIYINEIALRVHNSYHISLNCCNISQFETHIRSILNINIPIPKLIEGEMYNVISNMQSYEKVMEILKKKNVLKKNIFYQDYYKEPQDIRKIGHVNILQNNKNIKNNNFSENVSLNKTYCDCDKCNYCLALNF